MPIKISKELQHHVVFCVRDRGSYNLTDDGSQAELDTVQFLLDNLRTHIVSDYRLLVNYNIPMQGADSREVDIVLIDKFGVFLLEVKSWIGRIEAYDDYWIVDDQYKRENPLESINAKARILHSRIFSERGELSELRRVSVTGVVVLTEGVDRFVNHSARDSRAVVGLDDSLLQILTSTQLLHRGAGSRLMDSLDIRRVTEAIYAKHRARRDELVGNYRILKELSFGELFDAYEAQNVNVSTQHVRLKRYQLPRLSQPAMALAIHHFKRSVEALSALGSHTNILQTQNFFPDPERPDVFYEVTELVPGAGRRLDEIMARARKPFSLDEQLDYLEQLSLALAHAHNHKAADGRKSPVYHRNISPDTIFVTNEGVVKLADFDFAKYGPHTITVPGQTLVDTPFVAPEVLENASFASAVSDIYALGVLWYYLASVQTHNPKFSPRRADAQVDGMQLPEKARALLKKMTAQEPANRPQRVEEVLEGLRQLRQK
jgi:hypothetical protein